MFKPFGHPYGHTVHMPRFRDERGVKFQAWIIDLIEDR